MQTKTAILHIKSHMQGKATQASKAILSEVYGALKKAGFSPPFKIKSLAQFKQLFEEAIEAGQYEFETTVFRDGYPLTIKAFIDYDGKTGQNVRGFNSSTGEPLHLSPREVQAIFGQWKKSEMQKQEESSGRLYDDLMDMEPTKDDMVNLGKY